MGERSAAFGGFVIGTTMILALAYSLGDGGLLLHWGLGLLHQADLLAAQTQHRAMELLGNRH